MIGRFEQLDASSVPPGGARTNSKCGIFSSINRIALGLSYSCFRPLSAVVQNRHGTLCQLTMHPYPEHIPCGFSKCQARHLLQCVSASLCIRCFTDSSLTYQQWIILRGGTGSERHAPVMGTTINGRSCRQRLGVEIHV